MTISMCWGKISDHKIERRTSINIDGMHITLIYSTLYFVFEWMNGCSVDHSTALLSTKYCMLHGMLYSAM